MPRGRLKGQHSLFCGASSSDEPEETKQALRVAAETIPGVRSVENLAAKIQKSVSDEIAVLEV